MYKVNNRGKETQGPTTVSGVCFIEVFVLQTVIVAGKTRTCASNIISMFALETNHVKYIV